MADTQRAPLPLLQHPPPQRAQQAVFGFPGDPLLFAIRAAGDPQNLRVRGVVALSPEHQLEHPPVGWRLPLSKFLQQFFSPRVDPFALGVVFRSYYYIGWGRPEGAQLPQRLAG